MKASPHTVRTDGASDLTHCRTFGWRYLIAVALGALAVLAFLCCNRISYIVKYDKIAMYPYFYPACWIVGIFSVLLMVLLLGVNFYWLMRKSWASSKVEILFIELLLAITASILSWNPIAIIMIFAM